MEIVRHPFQRAAATGDLAAQRADMRGQQAVQPETVAFGLGEGGPLVGQRIGEQRAGGGVDGGRDGDDPCQKRKLIQPARKSELL
ncbi:hypothetical protein GCM10011380_18680 [Sphingomonas metalli]|uniref:Uncharacterized protein n=1 Tax=Sphingomonas metalli TaxID=1779358 RepID=A0A916WS43_9SPHN|nr:hypothetical protein GCM10011380_18680 [Sphingomonas metalli]